MNRIDLPLKALAASLMLAFGAPVSALPTGGAVSAGTAGIASAPGKTTVTQSSQNVAINWQSFSIGAAEAVQFVQPNASAVALNRVLGADPSSILGSLSANGRVFLVNPNGILFGQGAQVNVGGLVASTRGIADADFMAGRYRFTGSGSGTVVNQGTIKADGGYVALLGAKVTNEGVISASLGTVALAAGDAMTLDMAGDGLLNVTVDRGAVNALVENGGLIRANGGQVLLTAQAAGDLMSTVVNNTGVIEAQTLENRNGVIKLLGGMEAGTVNVGGTLDASAPNGGNGGFIETSAAHVKIADDARITTFAPLGVTGHWLIDPVDFVVGSAPGNDISGAALSVQLAANNVTIVTTAGPGIGNGDIIVNEAVTWNGAAAPGGATTLTLNALRDVNVNGAITATAGNLAVCCGRDVNVNAAITTTNGSILLAGGNNINMNAAVTATNGNIAFCAGENVFVNAQLTLVNSGSIANQSLGLPLGLFLSAGNNGTSPGAAGGSVFLPPAASPIRPSITRSAAPVTDVTINYNPASYATPTNYLPQLILVGAVVLDQNMVVYPAAVDKTFDGTTTATLSGFRSTALSGLPVGVGLVAGPGAAANFTTPDVGVGKPITFSGFTLGGASAADFALPAACCGPVVGRTLGNIVPAPPVAIVPPVVIVPPAVIVPPVVVAPPPVAVVPPVEVAPPIAVVPPVVVIGGPVLVVPPEQAEVPDATSPRFPIAVGALGPVAGLPLTVQDGGVRMPPVQVVQAPPPPPPAAKPFVAPPPPPAVKPFVAPPPPPPVVAPKPVPPKPVPPKPLPPRRDRN